MITDKPQLNSLYQKPQLSNESEKKKKKQEKKQKKKTKTKQTWHDAAWLSARLMLGSFRRGPMKLHTIRLWFAKTYYGFSSKENRKYRYFTSVRYSG